MTQHDYDIANADGATVRADLNSLFDAIASQNSGAAAPTTTFAFMVWMDTANDLLKVRDSSNTSWVTIASLSGTTWVAYSNGAVVGPSGPGKNLVQNGAMNVAQRGASFTSYGATNNAYSLDQYKIAVAGSASARWTVTQESSGGVSGNAKWLKALVTTADTPGAAEGQAIIQRPEGQSIQALRRNGGGTKAATYSFDVIVHADGASGLSFPVSLPVVFIIHDNVTDREIVSDVSVAAVDTWERVTVSFPEDTSGGGPVNTSSAGSSVGITLAAGSNYVITADTWRNNSNTTLKTSSSDSFADATNNYVGFTEVQLEVGSVATDFEHEDIGTTLAKCQRYFEVHNFNSAAGEMVSLCNLWDDEFGAGIINYTEKRATPTITMTAAGTFDIVPGNGSSLLTPLAISASKIGTRIAGINATMTAGTAVGAGEIRRDGTDVCTISITAEL